MCWKGSNTSFVKKILVAVYGVWVEEKVRRERERCVMCKKNGCGRKNITIICTGTHVINNMYIIYIFWLKSKL